MVAASFVLPVSSLMIYEIAEFYVFSRGMNLKK